MSDHPYNPTALGNERKSYMEQTVPQEVGRELRRIRKELRKLVRLVTYEVEFQEMWLRQQQYNGLFDNDLFFTDIFPMQKRKKRVKRKDRCM